MLFQLKDVQYFAMGFQTVQSVCLRIVFLLLFVIAMGPSPLVAEEAAVIQGEVSMPLAQTLEFYKGQLEQEKEDKVIELPMDSNLNSLVMHGRILEDGLDIEVSGTLSVFASEGYITIPVFELAEGLEIVELTQFTWGNLVREGNRLLFLSNRKGTHTFQFKLHKRAILSNDIRKVELNPGVGSQVAFRVDYDGNLFQLEETSTRMVEGQEMLLAEAGRYHLQWRSKLDVTPMVKAPTTTPEIRPSVKVAQASIISTLDGRQITRMKYDLHLQGLQTIAISAPEGEIFKRVYINKQAQDFEMQGQAVVLEVYPQRAGDERAEIEILLERKHEGFNLSGEVSFALPNPDWDVDDLFVEVHLPPAFLYEWRDGSLSPHAGELPKQDYLERMPEPGKKMAFHQTLVADTTPTIRLRYDVDLDGYYFKTSDARR